MNLYADGNADGVIDDVDGDGVVTLADVDNYPLDNFPGPEDIDRNGNGILDGADAISIVHTDSFEDNLPTGCINPADNTTSPIGPFIECAEIIPLWNQVRPARCSTAVTGAPVLPRRSRFREPRGGGTSGRDLHRRGESLSRIRHR